MASGITRIDNQGRRIMIPVLTAAVILVGAVAAADLLLSFAVIRRLTALQARGVGTGAGASAGTPEPGHVIGEFRVSLLAGGEFTTDHLRQEPAMVAFLSPTCEPCRRAIEELKQLPVPLARTLYVLIAGSAQDADLLAVAQQMPAGARVGAIAHDGGVMKAFAADGYPTVVSTADGAVLAAGLRVGDVLEHAHA
jgi:hypothetical protein